MVINHKIFNTLKVMILSIAVVQLLEYNPLVSLYFDLKSFYRLHAYMK